MISNTANRDWQPNQQAMLLKQTEQLPRKQQNTALVDTVLLLQLPWAPSGCRHTQAVHHKAVLLKAQHSQQVPKVALREQ